MKNKQRTIILALIFVLICSLFAGCDYGRMKTEPVSPEASSSSESSSPAPDVTPSAADQDEPEAERSSASSDETSGPTVKTYEYKVNGIAPIDPESQGNNWGNGAEDQQDEGWIRYWKAYGNSTTRFDETIENLLNINRTTSNNPQLSPNTAWVEQLRIRSEKKADDKDVVLVKPYLFAVRPQEETNSFKFDFRLDPANNLWTLTNGVYEQGSKPFEHLPSADGTVQKSTIALNPYEIGLTKKYQFDPDAFHAIFISHDGREDREYKVTWYDESGKVIDTQVFTGVLLDPTGSPTTLYTSDANGQVVYDARHWTSEKPYGTEERDAENRAIIIPRGYKGWFSIETPELEPGESVYIWDGVAILKPENATQVRESVEPTSANYNGGAILIGI